MKKVKFTTEEVLVCPHCHGQIEECDECSAELCIELGCKFDGYCNGDTHLCLECGGFQMGNTH